jgi:uncharacterized phosphatase
MTVIYLVRHGETDWNRERRIQGATDIPLNDTGRAQAMATGRLLSTRSWDAIIASPLARARETAEIIASAANHPGLHLLDEIVERRYGDAEGLTYEQVEERFPGDMDVPGRETRDAVAERVIPALVSLAEQYRGRSIVVVSHGGVIRAVLLHAATQAHQDDLASDPIRNGSVHNDPIRNGSVHSFRHTDGTLDLIAFDDPIETESSQFAVVTLGEQNAVERRDV